MFRVNCQNSACANTFELDFPLGYQKIPCPYCGAPLIATEASPSNLPADIQVHSWDNASTPKTEPPKDALAVHDDASQLLDEWLRTLEAQEVVVPPAKPPEKPAPKKEAPRVKVPVAKPATASIADAQAKHIQLRDLVEGGYITIDDQSEILKIIPCPNSKCRQPIRIRRGRGVRLALCAHCGQAVTIGHSD